MKITLCGSTKFLDAFKDWDAILTMGGHTVYSICYGMVNNSETNDERAEKKRRLDLVHLDKIDESDAILVLNVDGYYGESTTRELEWARIHRKDIYWLNNSVIGQKFLGPSVWTIYNLFNNSPIATVPEAEKYLEKPVPLKP